MEKLTALISTVLILTLALTAAPAFGEDQQQKVININEADASQLALLPRVGPALSARIVEFREENGEFKQAEDLILVRGIGEKTFELMEPYVVVSGKTTLTEKVRGTQPQSREGSEEDSDR